jgi:hypothetical protein
MFRSINELPEERLQRLQNLERLRLVGYSAGIAPVGTEFIVYGIMVSEGNVLYHLEDYSSGLYLVICLAELFDVTDPSASELWECRIPDDGGIALWPASWFRHDYYHDRLSDGEPELEADFLRLKSLFKSAHKNSTSAAEP